MALLLGLLGDEADVPRQDDAAAGELPHVADVQPGADDGTEEAGQGLVVEADPAAAPGAVIWLSEAMTGLSAVVRGRS
jgi:hypothetical protein